MNYIYDIFLNFNSMAYDIFEWNKTDKLIHIRKTPLIKVKTQDLLNLINKNVKLDIQFLSKIYKRTEQVNKRIIDYCFIGTDGKIVIAFNIDKKGFKYSQLCLEEEMEVLDFCTNLEYTKLNYKIIGEKEIDYFKTRNEKKIKNYIYNQLKKIDNEDKLNFLYLECFNKKSNNALKDIYYELENNFENIYTKIYKILKMTTIKR